jgi:hypothetical protein
MANVAWMHRSEIRDSIPPRAMIVATDWPVALISSTDAS